MHVAGGDEVASVDDGVNGDEMARVKVAAEGRAAVVGDGDAAEHDGLGVDRNFGSGHAECEREESEAGEEHREVREQRARIGAAILAM